MVNEYHGICCGESGTMYIWEIKEGRDHPIPTGRPEFDTSYNINMVGLMLQPMMDILRTEKTVIMDSGIFVLKGILEMRKREVYGSSLIKKRRY